jgi:hypothetical protein
LFAASIPQGCNEIQERNMPITVGIYDLFSYIIPGALYLFILNDFMRLIGWQYIEIIDAIKLQKNIGWPEFLLVVLAAYIAGNVFEVFRSAMLDRWLYYDVAGKSLAKIKKRLSHSDLEMAFDTDDWSICQEVLQTRSHNIIQNVERFKANALMMRNFSFVAFLNAALQLTQFLKEPLALQHMVFCLISLVVMTLTHRRARRFDDWNYRAIYSQALAYGPNLQEFLGNSIPQWKQKKTIRESAQLKKKGISSGIS